MANFSKFEKSIANALSYFPLIKNTLKKTYQLLNFFIYKKNFNAKSVIQFQEFRFREQESFFGYYDKSPLNRSSTHLLFHSVDYATAGIPDVDKPAGIILGDIKSGELKEVAKTNAYNWQQGARLQWITDNEFIYNDYDLDKNKYFSVVRSIKEENFDRKFDLPVQDSYKKEYFLSLNYRRLLSLRNDYGYYNLPVLSETELANLEGDGIWKVDFKTGNSKLILSLKEVVDFEYKNHFKEGTHYVNHIMISPNGRKVIFLHRYFIKGRRFDRLFHMANDGSNLKVLADNEMVSHCCWLNDENILGYLRGADGSDGYYTINCESRELISYMNGGLDNFGDGHPNVKSEWLVTDTYPDKSRLQSLLLQNLKTGEVKKVAQFFHGLKYNGPSRCDLHPSLSEDGNFVTVDTVYDGKRKLVLFDLSKIKN